MFSCSNTSIPCQLEESMYQWLVLPLFLFYFPMKIPPEEVHITIDVQFHGYGVIFFIYFFIGLFLGIPSHCYSQVWSYILYLFYYWLIYVHSQSLLRPRMKMLEIHIVMIGFCRKYHIC